jgi:hypothetical protein
MVSNCLGKLGEVADDSCLWNEQRVRPCISPNRKADISFCANGLRVGALVSQHNPLLLRAMASTSMLMKSTPTFLALADKKYHHQRMSFGLHS